jgi:transposase
VRALVAFLCVYQHLPVDRAGQLLADGLGALVATGTMAAVVAEGAAGLEGFVEVVGEGLVAAPAAHFDETGARVARAAAPGPLGLHRPAHAAHGACQAGQGGDGSGRGAARLWRGWRCTTAGRRTGDQHLSHTLCGAHLLRELEAITDEPGQGWPAARLLARLDAHREEVLRLLDDTRVPFDNNQAERDLRMVRLQHKIAGCWRTPAGAEAFLVLRSYLSTARKHGMNPLAVLGQLFQGQAWLPAPPCPGVA